MSSLSIAVPTQTFNLSLSGAARFSWLTDIQQQYDSLSEALQQVAVALGQRLTAAEAEPVPKQRLSILQHSSTTCSVLLEILPALSSLEAEIGRLSQTPVFGTTTAAAFDQGTGPADWLAVRQAYVPKVASGWPTLPRPPLPAMILVTAAALAALAAPSAARLWSERPSAHVLASPAPPMSESPVTTEEVSATSEALPQPAFDRKEAAAEVLGEGALAQQHQRQAPRQRGHLGLKRIPSRPLRSLSNR